jgi:hypothetical protein
MKVHVAALVLMTLNACQYHELGIGVTLPKEVALQLGCLAKSKTIQPIIGQVGTVIYAEKLAFISLPPPYMANANYVPCNLPASIVNGQRVRFSAQVLYQPEIVNGSIRCYMGQAIELTQLTLL